MRDRAISVVLLNVSPNGRCEGAFHTKMSSSFQSRQAERADWVVRPSPNCKDVRSEELPMKGEPCEDLTFGFCVRRTDLLSVELGKAAQELHMICRAGGIDTLRVELPGNGIRHSRGEAHPCDYLPNLQVLVELDRR
jgi:hypothetical protein